MTALTMPARPGRDADLRPVPWRQMAWVTWRQHRFALAGVAALLGALAVYLWLTGSSLHHAYAAATTCHPASSGACGNLVGYFLSTYNATSQLIAVLLQAVPALIGAFVGAPVLARELETGTFRFAWTQGFGGWRWTVAKLVPLAVAVTAAAGAFSVLFSWYYQPFFADRAQVPLSPAVFDLRGVAFAAWTLAAFVIGALAGLLIRRVVPAIAATLAAYTGLALAAGMYLREHYLTPLVARNLVNPPSSAWIISQQWYAKGGQPVSQSMLGQVLQQGAPQLAGKGGVPQAPSVTQYLVQHGYALWTSYQPGSRFWPFQWIEGGWLLALLLRLIGPVIMLSTACVFGSGIMLAVTGPGYGPPSGWLVVHRISFLAWLFFIAIHVLAHVPRLPRLLAAEARGVLVPQGETGGHAGAGRHARRAMEVLGGRGTRLAPLIASLLAGLVIALLTVHLAGKWEPTG